MNGSLFETEPLHRDLLPYLDSTGQYPMLRHPLVYSLLPMGAMENRAYEQKSRHLAEALIEEDWHLVVFLHERPYRLNALIDYVVGRDEEGGVPELNSSWANVDLLDLVADIWVDSENIEQCVEDWRALIGPADLWLGTPEERHEFDALAWDENGTVQAWRGGAVGDWSWTTDLSVAEKFSRRSGYAPRETRVHRDECFGYLTRRRESELLVRLTDERLPLVYP